MINPKVSVCIPTYNRSSLLSLAVQSALQQTYQNIEIVISDNHSADNTAQVIRSINDRRVVYHKLAKTVRPIENHNHCVSVASGSFITLLADDDLLKPTYVEKLLNLISPQQHITISRCGLEYVDQEGKFVKKWGNFPHEERARDFIYYRLLSQRPSGLSGYLFKKSDFEFVGGFEDMGFEGALYADDYLWFKLALQSKRIISTNEHLWSYRLHSSHLASNLNIDRFILNVPKYITNLEELSKKNNLDNDFLLFLRDVYSKRIISDRIRYELSRAKKVSYSNYLRFIRKNVLTLMKYIDIRTEIQFLYWKLFRPISIFKHFITKTHTDVN